MKLLEKLEAFKNAERTEETLPNLFKEIAEYFLCEGYFCVNGIRKVYICDVEFYYHEEEGEIKDWIMYHRNKTNSKGELETPEYFPIGQFNAHQSGIDITFEYKGDEDKGETSYRAGMLVRGFRIEDSDPEQDAKRPKPYDKRSTYFYEALLNYGSIGDGLEIKWKETPNNCELDKPTFRHNVADYNKATEKKIEWKDADHTKDLKCKEVSYKQCMRMWRFNIEQK